jgi:hypothetical protein
MSTPRSPTLPRSLATFGTADFEATLKEELVQLDEGDLPLQQGLRTGNAPVAGGRDVLILRVSETPQSIEIRAGIFYRSIIAGCSCADDPTPIDENTEYCEVEIVIDRKNGAATFALAQD